MCVGRDKMACSTSRTPYPIKRGLSPTLIFPAIYLRAEYMSVLYDAGVLAAFYALKFIVA